MKEVPQGVGRLPGELGSVTTLHWVSLMKARKEHITQCFFWEPASLQWLKSIKTVGKGPSGGREKSPLQHSVCFPLSPSPSKVKLRRSPWQATSLPALGRRWWGFKGSERFPSPPCLCSPPQHEGNERLVWNLNPAWKNFIGQVHRSAFQERDGFYGQRMLKGERGKKSRNLMQPEPTNRVGCPSRRRGPLELREGLRASAWDHPHPKAPGTLGTRDGHADPGKQNPLLTTLCPVPKSPETLLLQPAQSAPRPPSLTSGDLTLSLSRLRTVSGH